MNGRALRTISWVPLVAAIAAGCVSPEPVVVGRGGVVGRLDNVEGEEVAEEGLTNDGQRFSCLYDVPVRQAVRELRRMDLRAVWQEEFIKPGYEDEAANGEGVPMVSRRTTEPPKRGFVTDVAVFPGLKGGDVLVFTEPVSQDNAEVRDPSC